MDILNSIFTYLKPPLGFSRSFFGSLCGRIYRWIFQPKGASSKAEEIRKQVLPILNSQPIPNSEPISNASEIGKSLIAENQISFNALTKEVIYKIISYLKNREVLNFLLVNNSHLQLVDAKLANRLLRCRSSIPIPNQSKKWIIQNISSEIPIFEIVIRLSGMVTNKKFNTEKLIEFANEINSLKNIKQVELDFTYVDEKIISIEDCRKIMRIWNIPVYFWNFPYHIQNS